MEKHTIKQLAKYLSVLGSVSFNSANRDVYVHHPQGLRQIVHDNPACITSLNTNRLYGRTLQQYITSIDSWCASDGCIKLNFEVGLNSELICYIKVHDSSEFWHSTEIKGDDISNITLA